MWYRSPGTLLLQTNVLKVKDICSLFQFSSLQSGSNLSSRLKLNVCVSRGLSMTDDRSLTPCFYLACHDKRNWHNCKQTYKNRKQLPNYLHKESIKRKRISKKAFCLFRLLFLRHAFHFLINQQLITFHPGVLSEMLYYKMVDAQ